MNYFLIAIVVLAGWDSRAQVIDLDSQSYCKHQTFFEKKGIFIPNAGPGPFAWNGNLKKSALYRSRMNMDYAGAVGLAGLSIGTFILVPPEPGPDVYESYVPVIKILLFPIATSFAAASVACLIRARKHHRSMNQHLEEARRLLVH